MGVALGFGAGALAFGALAGYVMTPDDASRSYGSRNGFRYKQEAASREAALEKIDGQRRDAKLMTVIGAAATGASMFLGGGYRAGAMASGALLLGFGGASLLTLRNAEENVAHLPSVEELPPVRKGPWKPELTMPYGTIPTGTTPPLPPSVVEHFQSLSEHIESAQDSRAVTGP